MSDTIPQDAPLKQCSKCEKWFPATREYFHVGASNKYGLRNHCISCRSVEWALKHPKPVIAPTRECTKCLKTLPFTLEYFNAQKHGKNGMRSICKLCQKAYSASRASVQLERKKELRRSNPVIAERRREQERAYVHNNAEVVSKRKKAYYDAHPEQRRTEAHRRRALILEVGGNHTAQDVIDQYKRQRGKCYYCKKKVGKIYHIDHIIPVSRGGSNDPSNLVVTCSTCNLKKNNKLPHEWPEGGRLM